MKYSVHTPSRTQALTNNIDRQTKYYSKLTNLSSERKVGIDLVDYRKCVISKNYILFLISWKSSKLILFMKFSL